MIRLNNVTKVYDGGVVALKDVDLDVNKGEFVFLVGPSGSGKSTLIRLLMREETPTNGEIWVAGKHASALPSWKVPHLRRSIGTVFQDFKLLPNKTVYENVAFAMEVTGKSRSVIRAQVPQVLKLVGLSANAERQPRQLSGGEQQRVSIARAFVNRPLILLADEPTGNLDPATSVGVMRILDRINRTGTTVVMATHDHAIVDAMRRRVVQLDRGHVVRDESRGVYETMEQSAVVTAPVPTPPDGLEEVTAPEDADIDAPLDSAESAESQADATTDAEPSPTPADDAASGHGDASTGSDEDGSPSVEAETSDEPNPDPEELVEVTGEIPSVKDGGEA